MPLVAFPLPRDTQSCESSAGAFSTVALSPLTSRKSLFFFFLRKWGVSLTGTAALHCGEGMKTIDFLVNAANVSDSRRAWHRCYQRAAGGAARQHGAATGPHNPATQLSQAAIRTWVIAWRGSKVVAVKRQTASGEVAKSRGLTCRKDAASSPRRVREGGMFTGEEIVNTS